MNNYLVYSGKKDTFLINKPSITFFSLINKKRSNFYTEPILQNFNQKFEFNKKLSCNLSKIGDLLLDTYIYIKISNINEYINTNTNTIDKNVKFAWAKKLGFAFINKVELEIGGIIIDSLYGDWINIWYELSTDDEKKNLDKLIGNTEEIYSFTNTKESIDIYIPLFFWFKNSNLALPLIAIKYQNININVITNNKFDVCNISPTNSIKIQEDIIYLQENELIYQKINNFEAIGQFINYDIDTKLLYYISIKNTFQIPTDSDNNYKIIGKKSNFVVNPESNLQVNNYEYNFNININEIKLLTHYGFLDNDEKLFFEKYSHNYLINITQNSLFSTKINKNLLFRLNFHNPSTMLLWICKLKSNKKIDLYDYTDNGEYIINKSNILLNNIDITKFNNIKIFNLINPINNNNNIPNKGINLYSFSLNNDILQPNGTFNLSNINDIYLKLDFNKLINEEIDLLCFNKVYNILVIKNGICSLLFNN